MLQHSVRDFARRVLEPGARERDAHEEFSPVLYQSMAELGLTGLGIPPDCGGSGGGLIQTSLVVEELARSDASMSLALLVTLSLAGMTLQLGGSTEQRSRYLPRLAKGQALGAFAYSEPHAGSDAAALETRAVRDGSRYLLNGSKIFITNGDVAEIYLVWATLDPSQRHRGITCFVMERGTPGLRVVKQSDKLGVRASGTAQLFFDDCVVPEANRLGPEGQGFTLAMKVLDRSRPIIGAQAVGIAQGALDLAIAHVTQRQQFGKALADQQGIQWMLADMATEVDAARLLVYRAADLWDRGVSAGKESSMAKLFASETAMRVATKSVQLHGGYGYFKENPVERFFRDAKITEIYEGTSQIQRNIIARHLLQREH